MSEIMLAVLDMPDDLFWADDTMSRHQHNQVRKEAAKEIRENRARIAELEAICDEQRQRLDALFDGTESTPALVKIARLEAQAGQVGADAMKEVAGWLEAENVSHDAELIGMCISGPTGCTDRDRALRAGAKAFREAASIWKARRLRGEALECPRCKGTGSVCTGTIEGVPELFDCDKCGGEGRLRAVPQAQCQGGE